MSENYTLTTSDIETVVAAFGESDDVIGHRVLTVGGLCAEHNVTPKAVFESVNAHLELNATSTNARPIKGWSSSSIANAKTAFDLYAATGVSLTKGTKASRHEFAALVEDVRRIHGAKVVRTAIKDAAQVIAEDATEATRRDAFVTILTALKNRPAEKATPKETTPEDRFISALRAALSLAEKVELSDEQASVAADLINELADLGI